MYQTSFRSRRGAVVVLLLFCIASIAVFAAVVLNLAWLNNCREEVQSCVDTVAVTGAVALMEGMNKSETSKVLHESASKFSINNQSQTLSDKDILFGQSQLNADGTYSFLEGMTPYNAVRVTAHRDPTQNNSIPLFLGQLLGSDNINLQEKATATFADHDLAIVVDYAGLMNGPDRFDSLKVLVAEFLKVVARSQVNVRVSLTLFSKEAETVVPLTSDLSEFESVFNNIKLRGPRAVGDGMLVGLESLFSSPTEPAAKRSLVVLTECKAPQGLDVIQVAELVKAHDTDLEIFTFSKIADTSLAAQIAVAAGGTHYHGLTGSDLENALLEIVTDVPVFLID